MRITIKNILESEFVLLLVVILIGMFFFYMRNGYEYFTGESGGAYWDRMNYCSRHRDSKMQIYGHLITCKKILDLRQFCRKHIDENFTFEGATISCESFLGVEDDHSPYDSY